jgi:hypothetical protein
MYITFAEFIALVCAIRSFIIGVKILVAVYKKK